MQPIQELAVEAFDSEFESLIRAALPFVVRGLTRHWPAVEKGQGDLGDFVGYLSASATDEDLTAFELAPEHKGRLFYTEDFSDFNFQRTRLSLSEALGRIVDFNREQLVPTLYIGSTNLDHWVPSFNEENPQPFPQSKAIASLWVSNRSTVAPHFDVPHNLATVVSGKRRFTLFPPDQLKNLYIGPLDKTPAGQPISLVDVNAPDFSQFPRFKEAQMRALTSELYPGDAIFIPSLWWHQVDALAPMNTLVNYWGRTETGHSGPPLAALQHALLAFKDLDPVQRRAWRALFNFYVFEAEDDNFRHIPPNARGILAPIGKRLGEKIKANIRQLLR